MDGNLGRGLSHWIIEWMVVPFTETETFNKEQIREEKENNKFKICDQMKMSNKQLSKLVSLVYYY